ncbi:netrin receptor DCC-like [Glandiceps talaboti]
MLLKAEEKFNRLVDVIVLVYTFGIVAGARQEFVIEPRDTQVVEGMSVVMQCKLQPYYMNSYAVYWFVKDNYLHPDTTRNPRLTWTKDVESGVYNLNIASVTTDDQGLYECQIHFGGTSVVRSRTATLTVLQIPIPAFNRQPMNIDVLEGDTVTLPCQIDEFTEGTMAVGWVKGRVIISREHFIYDVLPNQEDSLRYSVPEGNVGEYNLQIKNASREDVDQFYCIVSFTRLSGGGHILQSSKATLSVVYPQCDRRPVVDYYIEGNNITTVCSVQGLKGEIGVSLSWKKNGVEIGGTTANKNNLKIIDRWNVSPGDDQTSISCILRLSSSSNESRCTVGPLNVHYAPIISIFPQSPKVIIGNNVTLTCDAHANPEITRYRWLINNTFISDSWGSRYVLRKGGAELTIQQVRKMDDLLKIACKAENEMKTNVEVVTLRVGEYGEFGTSTHASVLNQDGVTLVVGQAYANNKGSSPFSVIMVSVVAVLVILVLSLSIVICVCHRKGRKRRQSVKTILGEFSHPFHYYRSTARTNNSTDNMNDSSFDSLGFGHYDDLANYNQPKESTFKSFINSMDQPEEDKVTFVENSLDVIYAKVNKKRESERKPADGCEDTTVIYMNLPCARMTQSCTTEIQQTDTHDTEDGIRTDNLVYAELSHATTVESRSDKELTPKVDSSIIYAEVATQR